MAPSSSQSLLYDDNSWRIYVGTITTIVPATIIVILRYIARYVARAGLWWDDYTIVGALFFNWALAATRWVQIANFGLGQYYAQLTPEQALSLRKSFIATQVLYFTNATLTKASLLLLYYRIFGVIKGFRWVIWVSTSLVVGYYLACVVVTLAGCSPISKFWDPSMPGTCIDFIAFFRWNGVANMLLDVLILCLPYPMAWRLQATLRQKWILSGIFLLGGFVCVVSVLRITSFDFSALDDPSYEAVMASMWSSVEQSVGIICACLPTLRPLLRRLCGCSVSSIRKRVSVSPELSNSGPLSLPSPPLDEENPLDSAGSSTPPTPLRGLAAQRPDPSKDQAHKSWSSEGSGTSTSQLFDDGNPERHMPRPVSFA